MRLIIGGPAVSGNKPSTSLVVIIKQVGRKGTARQRDKRQHELALQCQLTLLTSCQANQPISAKLLARQMFVGGRVQQAEGVCKIHKTESLKIDKLHREQNRLGFIIIKTLLVNITAK